MLKYKINAGKLLNLLKNENYLQENCKNKTKL